MRVSEAYSEASDEPKMEIFAKIVNSWIFAKNSVLDVWLGSEHTSEKMTGLQETL